MIKKCIFKAALAASFLLAGFMSYANTLLFLNGVDIKDSGMAGASAPFSSDAFSAFVNPAGLSLVERQEISLVYYNLFEGTALSAGSYCLPLLEKGTLSVSVVLVNGGSIEERDSTNMITGTFDDSYTAVYASYGLSLFQFLSAGASVKYIYHDFYTEKSGGVGADLSFLISLPYDIRVALMASNIIKPEFRYSSGFSDSLPLIGSASAGWSCGIVKDLRDKLKTAAGLSFEEYSKNALWQAGLEYSVFDMFFIRGGVNNDGFTAGASLKYQNAELNYALVQKPADLVHRFSIAYSFGDNIRAIETQLKTKETKARYELIERIKNETVSRFEDEIVDLIKSGDYENARITIDKALVWAPKDDWFLEKEREVAILIRADKVKIFLADADRLMQDALYIDALVSLKNVLDLDPNNELATAKLKRAQELIRTLGENNYSAEAGNKEVIKQHFEAGLDSYSTGNFEQAIEEWDKVIKASPLQRQVYNYIKSAQEKLKKREEAVSLKKINEEKKLSTLYNDAVMLYTKGDFEKSIGQWKEYLKLDPNNSEAKNYIEKITKEYLELQKQKLEW
jgi:tetratricopeptide (TPR) repeat protein